MPVVCLLIVIFIFLLTGVKEFEPEMVESAPLFTKLIADYDVWTFEYGDKTRRFEKGFELYPHEPEDEIWDNLY